MSDQSGMRFISMILAAKGAMSRLPSRTVIDGPFAESKELIAGTAPLRAPPDIGDAPR